MGTAEQSKGVGRGVFVSVIILILLILFCGSYAELITTTLHGAREVYQTPAVTRMYGVPSSWYGFSRRAVWCGVRLLDVDYHHLSLIHI